MVLRLGTDQVYAVGEVVGDTPLWVDDFGDVDGWDLHIVRRVRYLWTYTKNPQTFSVHTLKFGPTILPLDSEAVIEWLMQLEVPKEKWSRELRSLPARSMDGKSRSILSPKEIGERLYDRGISSDSINTLLANIGELTRIAGWYSRVGLDVSEHETIAFNSAIIEMSRVVYRKKWLCSEST